MVGEELLTKDNINEMINIVGAVVGIMLCLFVNLFYASVVAPIIRELIGMQNKNRFWSNLLTYTLFNVNSIIMLTIFLLKLSFDI